MQEWKGQKSHAQIFYWKKNSIPQSFTSLNNIMACHILCDTNSIQCQATETNTVKYYFAMTSTIKNKTKQNKNNDTPGTDSNNQIWKKLMNNYNHYILSYFFYSQIHWIVLHVCKLRMGFSVPSIIWVGAELMLITIQRTRPAWPTKTKLRMTLDCSRIANSDDG